MRGGQNKVPTALALMRGNPGKRPLPEGEPIPDGTIPDQPPAWLDRIAKMHWHSLRKTLHWLTDADADKLAYYCQAYSRYRQVTMQIRKAEPADVNALLIRLEKVEQSVRGLGAELGMDPVSRTRINVKKADPVASFDDWERGRASS